MTTPKKWHTPKGYFNVTFGLEDTFNFFASRCSSSYVSLYWMSTYLAPPSLLSLPESICRWQDMYTRPSPGPTTGWSTAQSCLLAARSVVDVRRAGRGERRTKIPVSKLCYLWPLRWSLSDHTWFHDSVERCAWSGPNYILLSWIIPTCRDIIKK